MNQFTYVGTELELFAKALNWKNYVNSLVKPYVNGYVLEVGAGIGRNTCLLCRPHHHKWLCLEPDAKLFQILINSIHCHGMDNCYFQNGTIDTLDKGHLFDSVLYLDVLEHIYEDRKELIKASQHLYIGGHLIILAPAHQWLYTPSDQAIGHYRRYSKSTLRRILPNSIKVVRFIYLDCIGLLAVLGNKIILRQSQPSMQQINFWDNFMIPVSRKSDAVLGHKLGKSIMLIGKKV